MVYSEGKPESFLCPEEGDFVVERAGSGRFQREGWPPGWCSRGLMDYIPPVLNHQKPH